MNHRIVGYLRALSILAVCAVPSLGWAASSGSTSSDNAGTGNNECPVGLVSGLTLNDEFGPDATTLTHCIQKRNDVHVMFQINRFCADEDQSNATCTSPYALGNMVNVIDDYEITDGMVRGRDYQMIAIVYAGGGNMLIKGNKFQSQVQALMAKGVTFYFCENTMRAFIKAGLLPNYVTTGIPVSSALIDGVQYVTGGVTAILDHEALGWSNIAP